MTIIKDKNVITPFIRKWEGWQQWLIIIARLFNHFYFIAFLTQTSFLIVFFRTCLIAGEGHHRVTCFHPGWIISLSSWPGVTRTSLNSELQNEKFEENPPTSSKANSAYCVFCAFNTSLCIRSISIFLSFKTNWKPRKCHQFYDANIVLFKGLSYHTAKLVTLIWWARMKLRIYHLCHILMHKMKVSTIVNLLTFAKKGFSSIQLKAAFQKYAKVGHFLCFDMHEIYVRAAKCYSGGLLDEQWKLNISLLKLKWAPPPLHQTYQNGILFRNVSQKLFVFLRSNMLSLGSIWAVYSERSAALAQFVGAIYTTQSGVFSNLKMLLWTKQNEPDSSRLYVELKVHSGL